MPNATHEKGKTLWNMSAGANIYYFLSANANLEEAAQTVKEEGTEEVDRRVRPYQTPVTLETLLAVKRAPHR